MTSLRHSILVTTVVAVSLCSASVDSVKLSRKPKVGETHEYKTSMVLHTSGLEINVDLKTREKVFEIKPDGSYVVEETQSDQVISVGGQTQPAPAEATGKLTYSKTGEVVAIESAESDPSVMRTANLMAVIWPTKPVDIGSAWEIETKGDKTHGGSDIYHKFKVLARETVMGHDTFKISVEAKETSVGDASGTGTVWLDIKTGQAIKANGELKDVPAAGMMMDLVSYTVTLVE